MSTIRISIDTPLSGQTVLDQTRLVASDSDGFSRLSDFIQNIAVGQLAGKIRFNGNAAQASGTITFSSFADADTVTINGVSLTGKTTPSGTSQWAVGSSDQACANNLVAKVNASALANIVGCVAASRQATILIASMVAADTVTINSVVFTCTASPTGSDRRQFALGTSDSGTAANLLMAIGNCANLFPASLDGMTVTRSSATLTLTYLGSLTASASAHATVTSTIVLITCLIPGTIGNVVALAISAHGSVSGALLTGGTEGTEVIFSENYTTL